MVQSIARASTLNPLWLVIELHMSSLITIDSYNNNNNLLHAQAKLLLLHILLSFYDILIGYEPGYRLGFLLRYHILISNHLLF